MRKFSITIIATFLLSFLGIKPVDASILTIDKAGNVVVNVLSEETQNALGAPANESLRITNAPSQVKYEDAKVSLNKKDGKVFLSILSAEGGKNFDVTNNLL